MSWADDFFDDAGKVIFTSRIQQVKESLGLMLINEEISREFYHKACTQLAEYSDMVVTEWEKNNVPSR